MKPSPFIFVGLLTMPAMAAISWGDTMDTPFPGYGQIQNVQHYATNPVWSPNAAHDMQLPSIIYTMGAELGPGECYKTVSTLLYDYCATQYDCVGKQMADVRPAIMAQLSQLPGHDYATVCGGYLDAAFEEYMAQRTNNKSNNPGTTTPFPAAQSGMANYDTPRYQIRNPFDTPTAPQWKQNIIERTTELKELGDANGTTDMLYAAEYPKTINDVSFAQRMENYRVGIEPFKDLKAYYSIGYQPPQKAAPPPAPPPAVKVKCDDTDKRYYEQTLRDIQIVAGCQNQGSTVSECQPQLSHRYYTGKTYPLSADGLVNDLTDLVNTKDNSFYDLLITDPIPCQAPSGAKDGDIIATAFCDMKSSAANDHVVVAKLVRHCKFNGTAAKWQERCEPGICDKNPPSDATNVSWLPDTSNMCWDWSYKDFVGTILHSKDSNNKGNYGTIDAPVEVKDYDELKAAINTAIADFERECPDFADPCAKQKEQYAQLQQDLKILLACQTQETPAAKCMGREDLEKKYNIKIFVKKPQKYKRATPYQGQKNLAKDPVMNDTVNCSSVARKGSADRGITPGHSIFCDAVTAPDKEAAVPYVRHCSGTTTQGGWPGASYTNTYFASTCSKAWCSGTEPETKAINAIYTPNTDRVCWDWKYIDADGKPTNDPITLKTAYSPIIKEIQRRMSKLEQGCPELKKR